jgi:hypothetical protein
VRRRGEGMCRSRAVSSEGLAVDMELKKIVAAVRNKSLIMRFLVLIILLTTANSPGSESTIICTKPWNIGRKYGVDSYIGLRGGADSHSEFRTGQPSTDKNSDEKLLELQSFPINSFRAWDWITGTGRREDDDTIFTLFRNRETRAAVEFVHDDHVTCNGFFRFLSPDIFLFEPESPLYANFSKDCPGYACFVNGFFTGDFLQGTNLYHHLSATDFGERNSRSSGENLSVYSWNVSIGTKTITLSRSDCYPAKLLLTDDGFVYEGAADRHEWVRNPPTGVLLHQYEPPRAVELEEAREMIKLIGEETKNED